MGSGVGCWFGLVWVGFGRVGVGVGRGFGRLRRVCAGAWAVWACGTGGKAGKPTQTLAKPGPSGQNHPKLPTFASIPTRLPTPAAGKPTQTLAKPGPSGQNHPKLPTFASTPTRLPAPGSKNPQTASSPGVGTYNSRHACATTLTCTLRQQLVDPTAASRGFELSKTQRNPGGHISRLARIGNTP